MVVVEDIEIVRSILGTKIKVKTPMRTFRRTLREDQEGFYTLDRNEKCYLQYKIYRFEGYKPVIDFTAAFWIKKNNKKRL